MRRGTGSLSDCFRLRQLGYRELHDLHQGVLVVLGGDGAVGLELAEGVDSGSHVVHER
uniref:Uncharacterized protein n=1 Tax=uncultured marine virus TaxID=186617 RepID=A0A0F7L6C8_9VIRU|nr:hypothetical protein [uncultured marine virus]